MAREAHKLCRTSPFTGSDSSSAAAAVSRPSRRPPSARTRPLMSTPTQRCSGPPASAPCRPSSSPSISLASPQPEGAGQSFMRDGLSGSRV